MNIKNQSSEIVLDSGRKQIDLLENSLYLHNFVGNYQEISENFTRVDISLMDAIWTKIIAQQKKEEQKVYDILGIRGIDELNEKYLTSGGQNELLATTAVELIKRAAEEACIDLTGTTTKTKARSLSQAVAPTFEKMVEDSLKEDEEMMKILKDGLGPMIAKRLINYTNNAKLPAKMDDYVASAAKSFSGTFRGDLLELETGVAMARVMNQLVGKKGKTIHSAKTTNSKGKQIKADHAFEINDSITFGISEKNYTPDGKGNVEFALHSSGTLENFYRLVDKMSINGRNTTNLKSVLKVVEKFREPDFKYHLINQAAFEGVNKIITKTDVGTNIIDFVKTCIPLFIGAQFKIEGDTINVDFFNINGKLIPVSVIMEDIFKGGTLAMPRINLYSNYKPSWIDMLHEKLSVPTENQNGYYQNTAIKAGSKEGRNLYKGIKVGTIHLKVALAKMK